MQWIKLKLGSLSIVANKQTGAGVGGEGLDAKKRTEIPSADSSRAETVTKDSYREGVNG